MAKIGFPIARDDEEMETFGTEQSFGDVLISVTGNKMSCLPPYIIVKHQEIR